MSLESYFNNSSVNDFLDESNLENIDDNKSMSSQDDKNDTFDIRTMISRINRLTSKEKIHILNILISKNFEFTKNENGYFFNLINIDKDIFDTINNCLSLIEKNANLLKEMDRRRNELLQYYSLLIEDKIQIKSKKNREDYINKLLIKNNSNITFTFKKKMEKRKNMDANLETDSDALIKNYIKSKLKYDKNTVYYRIMSSIKLTKFNKSKQKTRNDDDDDNNFVDRESKNYNDNVDMDDESNVDITENESLCSVNLDADDIDDDDVYNIDNNNNFKNKIDKILDVDDLEDFDDIDVIETNEKKTENDFLYYKTLLNNNGFMFDENKNVILKRQEYII